MANVAVLFVRSDSVYKQIEGLDVYDIDRDARTFNSDLPVIAHPPCRAWGRLRGLAKPRHDEKELARFAVDQIRKNGGVLEHPESSTLWADKQMPNPLVCAPGSKDEFGGWTLPISQNWFGHKARKNTWLYIVGIEPRSIPDFPIVLGEAQYVVTSSKRTKKWKKEITKAEREHTPAQLAFWLVDLAKGLNHA